MSDRKQYNILKQELNERQWRLFLATEALKMGYGGISRVVELSGSTWKTVKRGIDELTKKRALPKNRVRAKGGGRKALTAKDPTLEDDLENVTYPKGDPESPLKWTTESFDHIREALIGLGHHLGSTSVRNLLKKCDYSLQADKKNIEEKKKDPDRNKQFENINTHVKAFIKKGIPVISVDCRKKENVGNFKNNGREQYKKGQAPEVYVYDFASLASGKAIPYGVYDIHFNKGFVNVGIDHDTSAFAVNSIRQYWKTEGKTRYPSARELAIVAESGGSNSKRTRLWKYSLQQLANETGLTIHVFHMPPGTSKWNKIEHKLFSFISKNWRGKPLVNLTTILKLIGNTKTKKGLTVEVVLDKNHYPIKIKISDAIMKHVNILKDKFRGDMNYTINPNKYLPALQ